MKNDHIFVIYEENKYAPPEDVNFALEFQNIFREALPEGATEEEINLLYSLIIKEDY